MTSFILTIPSSVKQGFRYKNDNTHRKRDKSKAQSSSQFLIFDLEFCSAFIPLKTGKTELWSWKRHQLHTADATVCSVRGPLGWGQPLWRNFMVLTAKMTSNPVDGWVLERQDPTWDISTALLLFPCSVLRPDVVPPALPPPATLNVGERAWMKLDELQQQAKPFFWGGVLSVSFTAAGYWQAKGGLQCLSYGATNLESMSQGENCYF